MNLVMTLLVRDEIDIVKQNIDFHLAQGVDHIIVTDNGSIDGTREILADLSKTQPVTVLDEPGRDYSQWKWVTRMAHMARDEMAADWILPNDADEFWWNGGAPIKEAIRSKLEVVGISLHVIHCSRRNMFFGHDDPSDAPWQRRLIYYATKPKPVQLPKDVLRSPRDVPHFCCDLPGKVLVKSSGLMGIAQGNHAAQFDGEVRSAGCDLLVYHFPVRSKVQFVSSILNGGESYQNNNDLPKQAGWHKRRLYWKYKKNGLVDAISDAIPSMQRIKSDMQTGLVSRDTTMVELLG